MVPEPTLFPMYGHLLSSKLLVAELATVGKGLGVRHRLTGVDCRDTLRHLTPDVAHCRCSLYQGRDYQKRR